MQESERYEGVCAACGGVTDITESRLYAGGHRLVDSRRTEVCRNLDCSTHRRS